MVASTRNNANPARHDNLLKRPELNSRDIFDAPFNRAHVKFVLAIVIGLVLRPRHVEVAHTAAMTFFMRIERVRLALNSAIGT